MTTRRSRCEQAAATLAIAAAACAGHIPMPGHYDRPAQLVGEWIDLRHTAPGDTALWVLRDNGYDGSAHLVAKTIAGGTTTDARSEHRYGTWYFTGTIADTSHRALCFAKRIGRDGPTCLTFLIDTTMVDGIAQRRLTIHGYQGEHYTGDRTLLEHGVSGITK